MAWSLPLYHEGISSQHTDRIDRINTDFLVVGAGVAGLRAAIALSEFGRVLVLAKDKLEESSSEYAQGGIAAALSDDDLISLHEQDTLYAGDGLCNVAAVHTLVEEGPRDIEVLIGWGAEFDKDGTKLAFGQEAAHSRRRILHAGGDSTGREIVRVLYFKAASINNIDIRSFSGVTDLVCDETGRVCGAMAWSEGTSTAIEIHARAVLLATGGLGRVFENTTNPDVATGDGVALAWRAGAEISDIEFVQFHPTALHVEGAPRFLLSEALRGEGALLKNAAGERFMPGYHELAELAPRDVVSRSIVAEMFRTGTPHVFLDLSHREPGFVAKRFPRIYETCLKLGIDLAAQAAPVHPAAHYAMGGVRTDLVGHTSLPGLYAAGEAACVGVHGANRLASNSLLEGLVYGRRAGTTMGSETLDPVGTRMAAARPDIPLVTEAELRSLAWRDCGIIRDGAGLRAAIERLQALPIETIVRPRRSQFELRNLHAVTLAIARCALARQESRGGHYRKDFPEKNAAFQKHSLTQKDRADVEFV
jgi:L-aspartate oxidase